MKLTDILNKNKKTVEGAEKVLEKAHKELGDIQAQVAEKNKHKQQLIQAMNVIEASLVIDPADKNAKAQKNKADKKLAEIDKEIEKLSEKAQKAQEALTEAQKGVKNSKGEVFKQEIINQRVEAGFKRKFSVVERRVEHGLNSYKHIDWVDWSKGYGLPLEQIQTPNGFQLKAKQENMPLIKEVNNEAQEVANKKVDELIAKVEKAIEEILEAEGIELREIK
ncbi:hypothetical protein [Bacillus paralicheniformis]|uniref:hypothetical protein n=1 Tax=Bacillus paralicheniformis TaxID=1648923 RepID=UPI002DB78F9D|nr:hypothetical protein [Bacillus paralicheniformis]MEC1866734.1 hypothetical protein [Bacillus paralicheniformis]